MIFKLIHFHSEIEEVGIVSCYLYEIMNLFYCFIIIHFVKFEGLPILLQFNPPITLLSGTVILGVTYITCTGEGTFLN